VLWPKETGVVFLFSRFKNSWHYLLSIPANKAVTPAIEVSNRAKAYTRIRQT
jgi:hypothetical protein